MVAQECLDDGDFVSGRGGRKGKSAFPWQLVAGNTDDAGMSSEMLLAKGEGEGGASLSKALTNIVDDEDEDEDVRRGELCKTDYGLGRVASTTGKCEATWFVCSSKPILRSSNPRPAARQRMRGGAIVFDESTDALSIEHARSQYPVGTTFRIPRTGFLTMVVDSETKMPKKVRRQGSGGAAPLHT